MSATHAKISQLAGVPVCEVVNLSQFALPGGDCGAAWPAQLQGIAFDEYIEEGNPAPPSDNFGGYQLWVKKDGAPNPGLPVPIPGPGGPPWGGPFVGTSRVGTPAPGDRCPNPVPPAGVLPPETDGILAVLDMRRADPRAWRVLRLRAHLARLGHEHLSRSLQQPARTVAHLPPAHLQRPPVKPLVN